MEKKTIGKFISALRKARGMTQRELGEKLYVSDKTVSRWERDECTPDLSLIPTIAEIFQVTTDELLRGERNNPDREIAASDESLNKNKAKSDKQLKLMLYNRMKKFTNLSFISIGLVMVGFIAAMICNLGFSRGLLGFCLASIFFVSATICQICFTVSQRLLTDDAEYNEKIKALNTKMVFNSVRIFFLIFLSVAFCLPIAVLTLEYYDSYYGLALDSWLMFGIIFALGALIIGYCVYKIFILKLLITREIIWLDEAAVNRIKAEGALLKKLCIIFFALAALILLVTYIVLSSVSESTFIKRERFDSPDKFIEYMQDEYDRWYEEGYGNATPEFGYPNRRWAEIDEKQYYYNPILYESINIFQHSNKEWEIVVTTEDADRNGQAMYEALNITLLSLHIVNLAVCIIYYAIKSKKQNKKTTLH